MTANAIHLKKAAKLSNNWGPPQGSIVDATLIPSARRPRKVEEVILDELASE